MFRLKFLIHMNNWYGIKRLHKSGEGGCCESSGIMYFAGFNISAA